MISFMESDWCINLGWILLHSLWIVWLVATFTNLLMKITTSSSRKYNLGMCGLVAIAILPSLAIYWTPKVNADLPEKVSANSEATRPVSQNKIPRVDVNSHARELDSSLVNKGQNQLQNPGVFIAAEESSASASYQPNNPQSTNKIATSSTASLKLAEWEFTQIWTANLKLIAWLTPAWLLGALAVAIRRSAHWIALRRAKRTFMPAPTSLQNHFRDLLSSMRLHRRVRLMVSNVLQTPFTVGILKPIVVVPIGFTTGFPPSQVEALLAHELAHIVRNDFLANLFQVLIEIVFFYHPSVRKLSRQIRIQREHCCDDHAIKICGDGLVLAEALAQLQTQRSGKRDDMLAMCAAGTDGKETLARVRRIVEKNAPQYDSRQQVWGGLIAIGALVLVAALPAFWSKSLAEEQEPESGKPSVTTSDSDGDSTEPWEISKVYDPGFLRDYLLHYEALPKKIKVPAIRGKILDPNGSPLEGASLSSHTPRHWLRIEKGQLERNAPNAIVSRKDGVFGLPERNEPYRVTVTHSSGVASVSHEELIRAGGTIQLEPWGRITGDFVLKGQPQANRRVRLYIDTLAWSYTKMGPRLTTEYQTKTDAEGKFVFDNVPPLPGRVHVFGASGSLGRGKEYKLDPGETTVVSVASGCDLKAKLAASLINEGTLVEIRPTMPVIPYPAETRHAGEQAERKWLDEWSKTVEGQRTLDRRTLLYNLRFPVDLDDEGNIEVVGLPPGEFELVLGPRYSPMALLSRISIKPDDKNLDLGTVDKIMPELIVRVVDQDDQPVNNSVLVYDRSNFYSGGERAFENIFGQTDESGQVKLGKVPHNFFCVQVGNYYALIGQESLEFKQTKPGREFVRLDQTPDSLTVTFQVAPTAEYKFEIVDAVTGEAVSFPEVFVQDKLENWWTLLVIDGGGQHDFMPFHTHFANRPLRAAALGYKAIEFEIQDQPAAGGSYKKQIKLEPMPEVEVEFVSPAGELLKDVKIYWKYANKLSTFEVPPSRASEGKLKIKYPTHADKLTWQLRAGQLRRDVKFSDLLKKQANEDSSTLKLKVMLNY